MESTTNTDHNGAISSQINYNEGINHNNNVQSNKPINTNQNFQQQNQYCQAHCNCSSGQSNLNLGYHTCLLDPEGSILSILPHHRNDCPFSGMEFNTNKCTSDSIMQYNIKYGNIPNKLQLMMNKQLFFHMMTHVMIKPHKMKIHPSPTIPKIQSYPHLLYEH
eukprot:4583020-Ditylum_brightwellii.AAC.1